MTHLYIENMTENENRIYAAIFNYKKFIVELLDI